MQWCVDVGRSSECDLSDEDFRIIAGTHSESSGTGFGCRDEQYYVYNRRQARELMQEFRELLSTCTCCEDADPEVTYVSMYWEPKSVLLWLIARRDYKEAWKHLLEVVKGA
jgi:hypothetical protein